MNGNEELKAWLKGYGIDAGLKPLAGDASLRKYYRIEDPLHSGIVMDASAQLESVKPFVDIAHRLYEADVRTPKINAFDMEQGFVFMEDLGSRHFYDAIQTEGTHYYPKAVESIVKMQRADTSGLPSYDRAFLLFEMGLMEEWYFDKHLGMILSKDDKALIEMTFESIVNVVQAQPQGLFVHRDYHSRNLMFDCNDEIVVIDFQDARVGALTYDLVSLLKDVYVELPQEEVTRLALYFRDISGVDVDNATFMKWFDFMGLQRHIKILGIFARLALHDGKTGYLNDIPLTLKYVTDVAQRYEETQAFGVWLEEMPR